MGKKARGNGSVILPHRLEDPSLSLSIPVKSRCVLQAYAPNPGEVDTKYHGSLAGLARISKTG